MIGPALVGKAAAAVATGLVGAIAYDGVKKVMRSRPLRGAVVTVTSWGLRGARVAETGAERARLAAADIVSEARQKIGEQTPPPGATIEHNH